MNWAAREGILSIFLIFAINAAVFMLTDKTLPLGIEAIGGIVTITVAGVGVTQARGYLNDRAFWAKTTETASIAYTPGEIPSTIPPGGKP